MLTEELAINFYQEALAAKFETMCDILSPEPEIPNLAHDIGLMFGQQWRQGESRKISEEHGEFRACVVSHLGTIIAKSHSGGSGVLNTHLPTLIRLNAQLKHVFLTGTEDEYDALCGALDSCDSREEQIDTANNFAMSANPPTVPVFSSRIFGTFFVRIIALIVARDIGNEAINDGSEGNDMAERNAFDELRDIIFSIADAHKCSCGGGEDDAPCTCLRGGGFDARVISELAAEYLSAEDADEEAAVLMSAEDIAEDILGCTTPSESSSESSGWEDDSGSASE